MRTSPSWWKLFSRPRVMTSRPFTAGTCELVICDLHMPGVHGQAVYETIRNRPAPRPVVLFMSGYRATDEKYEAFLRETGLTLLPKPFTVETLRQTVRRLLTAPGSS